MIGLDRLVEGAAAMGVALDTQQVDRLATFEGMLYDANRTMNLTRVPQSESLERHFLDSLSVMVAVDVRSAGRVLDLGTGGGLPGLALAIACPGPMYVLMDGTQKKLRFVQSVVDALDLEGVSTCHMRAEDARRSQAHAHVYDIVTARAVAPLPRLAGLVIPLLRPGGRGVALKSADIDDELNEAERSLPGLGGCVDRIVDVRVPGLQAGRKLVVMSRRSATRVASSRTVGSS